MLEAIERLDAVAETDMRLNGTVVIFEMVDERQEFIDDLALFCIAFPTLMTTLEQ